MITAVAKDSTNELVSDANVTFTASAGDLTVTQGTTGTNGEALATLSAGGAASGTKLTVTATSGTGSGSVVITVANTQQSIQVTTSQPQIPSNGSQAATITALVLDANNNTVSGATVAFTATSGGLTVTSGTTGADGTATATLTAANNPADRTITVTATLTSNPATKPATVPVQVTGTALSVSGPPSLVLGQTATYTASLVDSSGTGIANTAVALTSKAGNKLSAASVSTGSTGQVTFTLQATVAGSDTITGTALGINATQALAVSAQSFQFTTPPSTAAVTNVDLSTPQTLTVNWTSGGAPVVGQPVTFAASRGTLSASSANTDANGNATVSIVSSTSGDATVTAAGLGVTTTADLDFIATLPAVIGLQASPATIATNGQSTITATVRDANNNLVQGQTVDFNTVHDITGGTLSVASSQTNSQGQAQTVYTASSTASSSNGVVLQGTVQGTAISGQATLTVGGQSVFLSLGTGNLIVQLPAGCSTTGTVICTQFGVPYSVIAVDAAGNPVSGTNITLTVKALTYSKGLYPPVVAPATVWSQSVSATCPNEDGTSPVVSAQFNGILDPGEDGCWAGNTALNPIKEGLPTPNPSGYACNQFGNGNGRLDPGGTAVTSPSTVTTDSTGTGSFLVIYPQDEANWVSVELTATTSVQGTASTASVDFTLPILATDLTTINVSPPGQYSPYGQASSCSDPQ